MTACILSMLRSRRFMDRPTIKVSCALEEQRALLPPLKTLQQTRPGMVG
jgi:hypothetical protein